MKYILLFLCVVSLPAIAKVEFEKPSETVMTDLPADPLNPKAKRFVKCEVYPVATVKEISYGEKGAQRLSLLPGGKKPKCDESVEPGEHIILNWAGWFQGVKGDFGFFHGDDGTVRGGMPFLVYSLKLKRPLFADESVNGVIDAVKISKKNITLNYLRVYSADCSLAHVMGPRCKDKIIEKAGLSDSFLGACLRSYDDIAEAAAAVKCKGNKNPHCMRDLVQKEYNEVSVSPSVLNYKAEAVVPVNAPAWDSLDPKNYVKKKSEALKCYPAQ